MTLHTVVGPGEPDEPPEARAGESALSYAIRAIGSLFASSRLAHEQFQEARHDQAEAERLAAAAEEGAQLTAAARARAVAERHKVSPYKRIPRWLGTTVAVALALLDALPAYWTAEAFGLDQASTLVLTVLLCVALGGAMWLLDLFSARGRRTALRILQAVLAAGFAAMFVLRLDYLQVTGGEDLWSSALQALALTAVSAALLAVGFVVLSHRTPKAVADAERAARQAEQSGADEDAAAAHAKAVMSRAALEDTVVTWAVSHQPAGLGHEQFIQAIGQAIDILLHR
jgi:hypothetical protein